MAVFGCWLHMILIQSFYHYLSNQSDHVFDFDEADIWNTTTTANVVLSSSPEEGRAVLKSSSRRKKSGKSSASSLPMNIPDWSKILRGDYRENRHDDEDDFEEEEERGVWFPPHEFLARQRRHGTTTSFSVHEGIGRTLKGRDLSRVRNAVWKQTGFED